MEGRDGEEFSTSVIKQGAPISIIPQVRHPTANTQELWQQTLRDFASSVPHLGNKVQFASLGRLCESKRHDELVGDVLDLLAASQRQT